MKTLTCSGLSLLALMLASTAMAQSLPCNEVPCSGPGVDTSFGPFPLMDGLPLPVVVPKVLVVSRTEVVTETVVQEDIGGIRQDYNAQQMLRVGELDATQGRPLNMMYADDLYYLQGYTQGQRNRQAVPGRIQMPEPRRGFVGF